MSLRSKSKHGETQGGAQAAFTFPHVIISGTGGGGGGQGGKGADGSMSKGLAAQMYVNK